ncbi:aldo/keto reductase [Algisphaera agarilytica]|uniref:Aryl-alcohol dehydrogenase-like predicted oxidoreductase n=1 Tax=Algisphaera agarilytica TaxID=1385975 RepID=A0A7X0H5X7_9BACT|nr:aldo/keto reductase [Algisphaera agarilytica]MBB6428395.1 aryl-alcohol dehydrogenase-like predicted oxidoreductase [Algisphaera agarilytica]
MKYARLGETDIKVSKIAFGCMSTVANPTYDGLEDAEGIATIRSALDHGINFFDTAPAYGDGASEDLLGRALQDVRDQVIIANKVSSQVMSAKEVVEECEKSLKLLRTDYMDLYQIHWPRRQVPLEETLKAMDDLLKQGKVRSLGVCNFGIEDLTEALGSDVPLVSNQIAYSLLSRAVEFEVEGLCERYGIGFLCYSPLAQALLAGKYESADDVPPERARTRMFSKDRPQSRHDEDGCEEQVFAAIAAIRKISHRVGRSMADVSLAWLLHQDSVTSILVGASRPDQVARNAASAQVQLSQDDLDELDAVTQPVKLAMGGSLDMWATPSRIR